MSHRISSLRQAWGVLASGTPSKSLRVFPVAEEPRLVRAVMTQGGFRGMLVGVDEVERVPIPRFLQSDIAAALVGEVAYFDVPGLGALRFLHVWCRDNRADQAFEAFCALLWSAVEGQDAASALRECSDEFYRLLLADRQKVHPPALGLVGELIVLRRLLATDQSMLAAWTGPSGGRHDFRRGSAAIEVKATLRSDARGRSVRISDLDQLEPPSGGTLHLYLVRLERAMEGVISIRSLVNEIAAGLSPASREAFGSLIAGMDIEDADYITCFELKEEVVFSVAEGFPCLTGAKLSLQKLDPGVSKVTYDLALEAAQGFEVPREAAIDCLAGQPT